jgi:hypothetical protein
LRWQVCGWAGEYNTHPTPALLILFALCSLFYIRVCYKYHRHTLEIWYSSINIYTEGNGKVLLQFFVTISTSSIGKLRHTLKTVKDNRSKPTTRCLYLCKTNDVSSIKKIDAILINIFDLKPWINLYWKIIFEIVYKRNNKYIKT